MNPRRPKTMLTRQNRYLDRMIGGITLLALHEAGSIRGHAAAVQERLRIARRARDLGELLRDQIDLLPESRNRFSRDHQIRRQLWRGLVQDLSMTDSPRAA